MLCIKLNSLDMRFLKILDPVTGGLHVCLNCEASNAGYMLKKR